jgi:hypothetical protein
MRVSHQVLVRTMDSRRKAAATRAGAGNAVGGRLDAEGRREHFDLEETDLLREWDEPKELRGLLVPAGYAGRPGSD